jgi:hypothetical protein
MLSAVIQSRQLLYNGSYRYVDLWGTAGKHPPNVGIKSDSELRHIIAKAALNNYTEKSLF